MNNQETILRRLSARRSALHCFLGAFIAGVIVGGLGVDFQPGHPLLNVVATFLFGVCFVALVGSMLYLLVAYKCPQCGRAFACKWWYGNAFTTKCLHCGVRLDGANIKAELQQVGPSGGSTRA